MDGMTKQGDVREILGSGGKDEEWNGFSNNFGTESKESNNIKTEKRGMKASFFYLSGGLLGRGQRDGQCPIECV